MLVLAQKGSKDLLNTPVLNQCRIPFGPLGHTSEANNLQTHTMMALFANVQPAIK